jgi:hypothetical protein
MNDLLAYEHLFRGLCGPVDGRSRREKTRGRAMDVVGRSPTCMNSFPPLRGAILFSLTFAVALVAVPPAFAGDGWTPDTSRADRFKTGQSGQVYSWRAGDC